MRKGIVSSVRTLLGRASQGAERRSGSNEGSAEEDQSRRRGGMQGEVASDHRGVRTFRAADETDGSRRRGRASTAAAARSEASSEPGLAPGNGAASAPATAGARRQGETLNPRRVPWEVGGIFTVISGVLGFSVHRSDEHTYQQIDDHPDLFLFSGDEQESYEAFCADFGPVNLGVLNRFCTKMRERMQDPRLQGVKMVYYSEETPENLTNTIFLLAAYLVVDHGYTAEEAWAPFKRVQGLPILTFRDATYLAQDYDLEILHCLMGLRKAMEMGWYDARNFGQHEYELLDNPENADMHFLSPDFVAFKGPSERRTRLMAGVYSMTPKHYSSIFLHRNVANVLRLNEPTTYDKAQFEKYGIKHYDLYFDDCTTPSNEIVSKFLRLSESIIGSGEKLAVHCKAGLGRTGTLIAIYWMKHYGFTAHECLGWQRIVRPGSVIGQQQQYLHWAEEQMRNSKLRGQPNFPTVFGQQPAQALSPEESARLGLEVAAAQNARSSGRYQRDADEKVAG